MVLPQERYLLKQKKDRKNIRNKELADYLNCSPSLISLFFSNQSGMSGDKIDKMKEYIDNKIYYLEYKFPAR